MSERSTLNTLNKEVYCNQFELHDKNITSDTIHLFTECSKSDYPNTAGHYYMLEIFYSVGAYGSREYLIGLSFGHPGMSKAELDHEIIEYLYSQFDETFPALIHQYYKKEALLEQWLDESE